MLGEVLRLLRVFNNMTQAELADYLGVSAAYVSEIEKDKKVPSLQVLAKYSERFDVKVSTLLRVSESMKSDGLKEKVARQSTGLLLRFLRFVEQGGE